MKKRCVILFAKNPKTEQVKTRLTHAVGENKARRIYEKMLATLIATHKNQAYDFLVYVKGDEAYFSKQGLITKQRERTSSFDEVVYWALHQELMQYEQVIALSPDVPQVSVEDIEEAFTRLETTDVVVGPTLAGSYYLVGLKEPLQIFTMPEWDYATSCKQALTHIENQELSHILLPERRDIVTYADVTWYQEKDLLTFE